MSYHILYISYTGISKYCSETVKIVFSEKKMDFMKIIVFLLKNRSHNTNEQSFIIYIWMLRIADTVTPYNYKLKLFPGKRIPLHI